VGSTLSKIWTCADPFKGPEGASMAEVAAASGATGNPRIYSRRHGEAATAAKRNTDLAPMPLKCAVFRFRMRTAQNIIDCYAPDFGYVSYEASS
jgi:hypothetical protein